MAGGLALRAKVTGGFDQTDAEDLLPEAIDGDAGGQGVILRDEPAGKVQSVGSCLVFEW